MRQTKEIKKQFGLKREPWQYAFKEEAIRVARKKKGRLCAVKGDNTLFWVIREYDLKKLEDHGFIRLDE